MADKNKNTAHNIMYEIIAAQGQRTNRSYDSYIRRLVAIIFMTSGTMKKVILTISIGLTILTTDGICQKGPSRFFGEPILTDTLSTIFIPTRYNEEFLSSNKIAFWVTTMLTLLFTTTKQTLIQNYLIKTHLLNLLGAIAPITLMGQGLMKKLKM